MVSINILCESAYLVSGILILYCLLVVHKFVLIFSVGSFLLALPGQVTVLATHIAFPFLSFSLCAVPGEVTKLVTLETLHISLLGITAIGTIFADVSRFLTSVANTRVLRAVTSNVPRLGTVVAIWFTEVRVTVLSDMPFSITLVAMLLSTTVPSKVAGSGTFVALVLGSCS